MLYRVELCVAFANVYGDIDEAFYSSTENAFEKACKRISDNNVIADFEDRCKTIIQQSGHTG